MEKRWLIPGFISIAVIVVIVLVYRVGIANEVDKITKNNQTINEKGYCNSDSDCVPDSCCHAKGCVNKENAPNCKGVLCTMECREGTLDCYGKCKCVNNNCEAVFENEIANPASVYCKEQGGELIIKENIDGNQYGICKLADGRECDEWEYYKGNC